MRRSAAETEATAEEEKGKEKGRHDLCCPCCSSDSVGRVQGAVRRSPAVASRLAAIRRLYTKRAVFMECSDHEAVYEIQREIHLAVDHVVREIESTASDSPPPSSPLLTSSSPTFSDQLLTSALPFSRSSSFGKETQVSISLTQVTTSSSSAAFDYRKLSACNTAPPCTGDLGLGGRQSSFGKLHEQLPRASTFPSIPTPPGQQKQKQQEQQANAGEADGGGDEFYSLSTQTSFMEGSDLVEDDVLVATLPKSPSPPPAQIPGMAEDLSTVGEWVAESPPVAPVPATGSPLLVPSRSSFTTRSASFGVRSPQRSPPAPPSSASSSSSFSNPLACAAISSFGSPTHSPSGRVEG